MRSLMIRRVYPVIVGACLIGGNAHAKIAGAFKPPPSSLLPRQHREKLPAEVYGRVVLRNRLEDRKNDIQ